MTEIDRVADTTTFNEQNLLDGTFTAKGLQVGAEAGQHINISITAMSMSGLVTQATTAGITRTDSTGASVAVSAQAVVDKFKENYVSTDATTYAKANDFASLNAFVKNALQTVSLQRSDLGAVQNRLEHTIANLDNVVENTTSAEATIRDTDMATTMVQYANNQILAQAGTSMLAQSNQSNQGVLSLLG